MDGFRSRSYAEGRMQMEVYGGRAGAAAYGGHGFRSYSTSHAAAAAAYQVPQDSRELALEKGKRRSGSRGAPGAPASSKGGWGFLDPELQRKKRVAGYKLYSVEGKMKISFRRSFRWIKDRYTQVIYGFR